MIMTFIKGHQTERNSFGFSSSMLVAILFSILLLSCDSPSGPNYKRDKEQRLRVKPVLLVEDELFTVNDVAELIDRSTIRRGGYVAILSTSLTTEDKAAIELRSQFYNKQIEAVHILYVKPHSAIKNTDVLTIENATVLCVLDGDISKFVPSAGYPDLKSAILNAYKKGALLVLNGQAGSLAEDSDFKFDEVITLRLSE